jgi:ribosome-binding ATPase YchF (GTP1/OBG family)
MSYVAENDDIIHVDGTVDPVRDAELVNLNWRSLSSRATERVRRTRRMPTKIGAEKVMAV